MKILIVDDEEKLLKILRKYFEVEGFCVETALDGEEAICKIDENKIDLVILMFINIFLANKFYILEKRKDLNEVYRNIKI